MVKTLIQNLLTAGHYIVSEASGMYRSREQGIVASGSGVVPAGMVMGRVTANNKWKPWTAGASDGSQNALGILFQGCDATSADVRRVFSRRDCEVQGDVLQWAPGVTDNQKTTAMAQLAALGIIGR